MIKYIFIFMALVYTCFALVCYEYDDEGDPFAPPVENMTTKVCAKRELCYHEDYYGQHIRGCRKRKMCPSNLAACVNGVCCCKKNLCNKEQPPPLFNCYSGQARIEEDPEEAVGRAPCHSWCMKEYKVEVTYSCATDWVCRDFKNICGSYIAKNGLRIDVCCCKGDLCNRRFDDDPPFVPFEDETTEDTTTVTATTVVPTTDDSTMPYTRTTTTSSTEPSTSTAKSTRTTAMETEVNIEYRHSQETATTEVTTTVTTTTVASTTDDSTMPSTRTTTASSTGSSIFAIKGTTTKTKETEVDIEYRHSHETVEVVKEATGIDMGAVLAIVLFYGLI